jgi:mannose-1-phosphate guanylyltransferase
MQAIILSGGKGERLYPLTKDMPKPMLPINGKPHLEYQIRLLKLHGITDIIFSTGYLHEKIEEYFGDGSKFGVNIQYQEDGDEPLGTAGALRNCWSLIYSDDAIVMNGDILTNIDLTRLVEVHKYYRQPITMALIDVPDMSGFGIVQYDDKGKITAFTEKADRNHFYGNKVNAGIYIIKKDVIYSIPNGFSMLEKDVFPKFVESKMVQAFLCSSDYTYWLDIGTPKRYKQAQIDH